VCKEANQEKHKIIENEADKNERSAISYCRRRLVVRDVLFESTVLFQMVDYIIA